MAPPSIQQLIDAGVEFTEMTRKQADAFVKQLVKAGEVPRRDAESVVKSMVDRGRETSERISTSVQREVAKQVGWMSERFDELEDRFEALAESLADRVPGMPAPVKKAPAKKTAAKKAPAKKTPAKKTAAKKAPAKKAPAKKAPAKKAPAKKAPAKKAVGSSGVRKVATTRSGS